MQILALLIWEVKSKILSAKGLGISTKNKIGGTIYEVETSFSGTETLNKKIIRLILSEKLETKGADNLEKARYNSNIHSVLLGDERRNLIMNKPDTIAALYCRLSPEDVLDGDSNSINPYLM